MNFHSLDVKVIFYLMLFKPHSTHYHFCWCWINFPAVFSFQYQVAWKILVPLLAPKSMNFWGLRTHWTEALYDVTLHVYFIRSWWRKLTLVFIEYVIWEIVSNCWSLGRSSATKIDDRAVGRSGNLWRPMT